MISIHKISISEVETLSVVAKQTFLEAYAADIPVESLQIYVDKSFSKEKLVQELLHPDSEFYLAKTNDGQAAAYLKLNSSSAQTSMHESPGLEIERIYVLQKFQGMQIGKLLFNKSKEIARLKKLQYVWLCVWEKNPKAIRFYEKNGLIPFGTHLFKFLDEEMTDIMMKFELGE